MPRTSLPLRARGSVAPALPRAEPLSCPRSFSFSEGNGRSHEDAALGRRSVLPPALLLAPWTVLGRDSAKAVDRRADGGGGEAELSLQASSCPLRSRDPHPFASPPSPATSAFACASPAPAAEAACSAGTSANSPPLPSPAPRFLDAISGASSTACIPSCRACVSGRRSGQGSVPVWSTRVSMCA